MIVGVPKETLPGERRVALSPMAAQLLAKKKIEVLVERGAGASAGFTDKDYESHGARLGDRAEVFAKADVVFQVRCLGANKEAGRADLDLMRKDQLVLGHMEPLTEASSIAELAGRGVTGLALELVPRTTRAQSMDVLSSQANLAGYKAVLLAAVEAPKIFPMLMTAAGTLTASKVLVVGAGVAGLQAIATAKRLGAQVLGYDVRPEVKEQIQSLGAKFVELPLEAQSGSGGYAKEQGEEFLRKQRELMARVVAESDAVITTAAVPGRKAPVIVTEEMVDGMQAGSVIVDLAAERGGNCALTKAGETVEHKGVRILGPMNVAATIPSHASQAYARNLVSFLMNMVTKEGALNVTAEDDIVKETLVCRGGEVVHPRIRELLGQG
ncbi:MAG: NAD(P) transhydrogenase subunit alpha [Candidatus Methylomirabilis sp.]|nr:NAD(P) transhydrogenase subunit alpha [Deltaproteobacteria bacterium]